MLGALLFIVVSVGCLFILWEVRRKHTRKAELIAREKSDIATISNMTANMVTFSVGSKTCILGASDSTGLLFFRVISANYNVAKMQLLMTNITQVQLFIDGTSFPSTYSSSQPSAQVKATEVATFAMAEISTAQIERLRSLELRIDYLSTDSAVKTLSLPLLHARADDSAQKNTVQLIKHSIWWLYFLKFAVAECKKNPVTSNPVPQADV